MRGVQRTRKMRSMFLTREVSQLIDWWAAECAGGVITGEVPE